MRAIDIKLFRELWSIRSQALAIALVIVSGVGIFIMSLSTLDSLQITREVYYREHRFADVFVNVKRAPLNLVRRIESIPGVDRIDARVVAPVNLEIEGFPEPISGRLISVPYSEQQALNTLYLRKGRQLDPARNDEIILVESFASSHRLEPGDSLSLIINGRKKAMRIVGIALSPEHIYQLPPGALMPDFKRYAVMWMSQRPLSTAYGMEGAFNDLTLTLTRDASQQDVIDRLDHILAPYGGLGAYGRQDQISHHFLTEEMRQLQTTATAFPIIFFGVAAFLLNIVMTRLINLQREEIASLKAFGYSNLAVGLHYTKLVLIIIAFAVTGGVALGVWLGQNLNEVYTEYYSFPYLQYVLQPGNVLAAVLISIVLALSGTFRAIYNAARLPPAQAMQPAPPPVYRTTLVERIGLQRFFRQPTRMIFRHIERQPIKSGLSVLGIAFACGIMIVGLFQEGSINYIVDVQFRIAQKQDISVTFSEPTSYSAAYSLMSLPGVLHVEASRDVPVRLRHAHYSYRTSINGIEPNTQLTEILDTKLRRVSIPPAGIVLGEHLGKVLHARPGDTITVEILEGERPVRQVVVAGLTKQYLGMSAYMQRATLNRLMREDNAITGADLAVEPESFNSIYAELREMPRIVGTHVRKITIQNFYDIVAESILFFTFVASILGAIIAFGVVYNTARITLAERSRELASLRVLGFTRSEVAYILLGEQALLTLVGIPLGFYIGYELCHYLVSQLQTELYRIPLVILPKNYTIAAVVVLLSSLVSGILIWKKLRHLDLVAVLKTKE